MTKLIHMCLDVRGALANWSDREMRGVFKDNGRTLTPREAKEFLMDEIAKGHRVIPIGDCDAFDFETGCPGHPVDDDGTQADLASQPSAIAAIQPKKAV
jgi:hypothetical protein